MVLLFLPKFLTQIIIIVGIYYLIKFFARMWLRKKVAEAQRLQNETMSEQEASFKKQQQGQVHIKQQHPTSSHNSSGGDYVEYEEVED